MYIAFGTDGLRGQANTELTPEVSVALGRAAARTLNEQQWVIGWDTRTSSTMLAAAFSAGVTSAGRSILQLGGIPTAGLAFVCSRLGVPGAMVTASHNEFADNGIKIFGATGEKLPDEVERAVETLLHETMDHALSWDAPSLTGQITWVAPSDVRLLYRDWLFDRATLLHAGGLRIAVDCANGAAYDVAPVIMEATGASLHVLGSEPNGININSGCGSTDLTALISAVTANGLDFGVAFDGDADRILAVDDNGNTVDGDQIISILAKRRSRAGRLPGNGVVVTEWSNLGLLRSLTADSIAVDVCAVGDKAVAEAMKRTGYALGGEQSGHIIMSDISAVGDGISTALELVGAIVESGTSLSKLSSAAMTKLPQMSVKVDVRVPPKEVVQKLTDEAAAVNNQLRGRGRLVLRASGTESVVRVMAETDDADEVRSIVNRAVAQVAAAGRSSRAAE